MGATVTMLVWVLAAILAAAAAYWVGSKTFPAIGNWANELRAQADFERTGSLKRLMDVRDAAAH